MILIQAGMNWCIINNSNPWLEFQDDHTTHDGVPLSLIDKEINN